MVIKKLIIYGYGKWIDTEFDITAPFHLFYGENEAGKSTLMSFIHSIFFGFPTRHSSANRYEPKESSRYGGRIVIWDERFGEVTIERVAGKVTGDVTVQLEDGTVSGETMLTTLFHSKSRSFYESIYSFDLKGIENIQELSKEQLNRYFLSIGALGHEKYLKQADHYHTQAGKLFKPMGRKPEINQLQLKLKDKQRVVEKAKEKNVSYIDLMTSHFSKQETLKEIEKELTSITDELNHLNELSKYKETLEEIDRLKESLKTLSDRDRDLPEDGLYYLKQTKNEMETYQQKINELQDKQKNLQEQYKPSKELVLYQQNEDALKEFERELDSWEDKVHDLQLKNKDIAAIEQTITELKIRENISLAAPVPSELEPSDINYLNKLRSRSSELESRRSDLEEASRNLTYRISINNDMMDKIEPQLMPVSEFNALEELEENTGPKNDATKHRLPALITAGVVFLTSIYLFTVNLFYGAGALLLFALITYFVLHSPQKSTEGQTENQRDHLYRQKSLREQWKELLAMNDDYQSKQEKTIKELNDIKASEEMVEEDFSLWKKNHAFSDNVSLGDVEDKRAVYTQLRDLSDKETELKQMVAALENSLNEKLDAFEQNFTRTFLADDVLDKFKEMRSIFREIKNEQRGMQDYIKRTEAIQHEINYYVQKLNELKKSKRQFIGNLHCESEEDVYELYTVQKERQSKENRLKVLFEKLPVKKGAHSSEHKLNHLDEDMDRLKGKYQEASEQQKAVMKEIMSDEMQIKQLEDGGTYTELLQEFENEKSYYQEVVNTWMTLKTAAGIIEKTLQHAKEDKLPQALAVAS
ncbi:MAG: AAA family ATPase, partial [Alkalibacterium sp.]